MFLHQKFFYLLIFFLVGVAFASLVSNWSERILAALILGVFLVVFFWLWRRQTLAILAVAFILGSQYFFWDDFLYSQGSLDFAQKEFSGRVVRVVEKDRSLEFDLKNDGSRVRVYASLLEDIKYGEFVLIEGEFKDFPEQSRRYFEKEGVQAIVSFPEIEKLSSSLSLRSFLFSFRDRVQSSFERLLPSEQASFLTGLTLGKNAGISDELEEKLRLTGTTHLIALSGYNITIVALAVGASLSFFFSRRMTFLLSSLAIVLFVLMTGAEASVVRAGVMGILVLLADQTGRIYSFKNAIIFAAFLMTLFNPKVLLFDLGFQLSFIALMGIVYLRPMLASYLHLSGRGVLAWKENFLSTVSAQIAVAPLLLFSFGFISLIALITNLLILSAIPLTMFFGFLTFLFSLLSNIFALIPALLSRILLAYELWVIDFFSGFSFGVNYELSVFWLLLIYAAMIWLVYSKRKLLYARK